MIPRAFAILLFIGAFQSAPSKTPSTPKVSSSVSISLPPDMLSETVQIIYFMVGSFGGYGGYTKQQAGLHSYEIAASVEGKSATEIRMIAYAPGCEIQTFVVPLADDSRVNRKFECQPVRSVMLSGQIVPNELIQVKHTELIVTYMAFWSHQFFGIADGAVAEFRLATVSTDTNGMFQVELPLFSADDLASSSQSRASLRLMLRDPKTLNHVASNLEPELLEHRSEDHGLRIQSYYPNGLKFMAKP